MLKSKKIQGIDSLRALGVLMVLIYHLFPTALPGGFIGVDLFFVFSGYLTTALLFQEYREKIRIDLLDFHRRRIRRLLPAMCSMLGITLSASLLISPDFRVGIRRQLAAVLGFVTNYFEISGGKSYEDAQLPHLFVHSWTLAVEMHYYLIWAAAIALVFFCLRKKTPGPALFRARRVMSCIAVALAVISYIFMRILTKNTLDGGDPSAGYFATHSHFFPLMLGSLTALHFGYRTKSIWEELPKKKWFRASCFAVLLLGTAGLCAMALSLQFSAAATYSWGLPLTSIIACLMIAAVRLLQEERELKELKLLVWLGSRSFGIYLYHWPLLIIFSQIFSTAPSWAAPLCTLAVTLPITEFSFKYIETYFRASKKTELYEGERKAIKAGKIASIFVALALILLSGAALASSPAVTSLELELTRERRLLDAEAMQNINDQLSSLNGDPIKLDSKKTLVPISDEADDQSKKKYDGGVTMVGDSVMLGAASTLRENIADVKVDALVSRNMGKGLETVEKLLKNDKLRKNFVLGLSTNVTASSERYLREILDKLKGGEYHVVLVTGYGSTGTMAKTIGDFSDLLRTIPNEYDFCLVADWGAYAKANPEILTSDRIHLKNGESRRAYTKIITDALDAAQSKPTS